MERSLSRTAVPYEAARRQLDPFSPVRWVVEQERVLSSWVSKRVPAAEVVRSATLFLVGAECPFSCVFCDLSQHTLLGRTPPGAIAHQVRQACQEMDRAGERDLFEVKLYNASNYFDERAVPSADDAEVCRSLEGIPRIVVECHPRLVIGPRCELFARRVGAQSSQLEIALGLETSRPEVFSRLSKGCDLDQMSRAFQWLAERGVATRAFVLVGLPWISSHDQVAAVVETVGWAARRGVSSVSLIPLRPTKKLQVALEGDCSVGVESISLGLFEDAVGAAMEAFDVHWGGPLVVRADLWDLELLACCTTCGPSRRAQLAAALVPGSAAEPRPPCEVCGTTRSAG